MSMKIRPAFPSERGQSLLLIALAFIGLIAITGLAIDAGIVYTNYGHLRKAVDTAALSAANQFRQGVDAAQLQRAAKEFILFNLPGINPDADVVVYTCKDANLNDGHHDFCSEGSEGKRVRVEAGTDIDLAFLPIINFYEVRIQAAAESEAASVDLVLILDNSPSMAYDSEPGSPECNADNSCQPFRDVKEAAERFVHGLNYPYDRVSIVTYSRFSNLALPLTGCSSGTPAEQEACVVQSIQTLQVAEPIAECPAATFHGCTETNTSAGLMMAHLEFKRRGREDAIWIAVLLSDGVANAAHDLREVIIDPGPYPPEDPISIGWYCPQDNSEEYNPPYCQDGDASQIHSPDSEDFDADDATRYIASVLACLNGEEVDQCPAGGGDGAVIFSIGLGEAVTNYSIEGYPPPVDTDVGEQLLRFIANAGIDGNPDGGSLTSDPCFGAAVGRSCGNYFFSPDTEDLDPIFETIMDRIFTRLTK